MRIYAYPRLVDNDTDNFSFDAHAYRVAFGTVINSRRLESALSRALFARMAGVGASHVFLIESGEVAPSIVTVRKLADALGCTAADLLAATDELMRRDG